MTDITARLNPPPFALIGITGPARSGKDTLADYLCALGLQRHSFAKPLKAMVCQLLHCTLEQLEAMDKEAPHIAFGGKSLREVLQTLGTEWGRERIWTDLWLARAAVDIRNLRRQHQVFAEAGSGCDYRGVVLTDVRFGNEADYVRSQGGTLIHVHRDHISPVRPHQSENGIAWLQGDIYLHNNGSIHELYNKAGTALQAHRLGHLLRSGQPRPAAEPAASRRGVAP